MKVIITFTFFWCDEPGKLREFFFSYFVATLITRLAHPSHSVLYGLLT